MDLFSNRGETYKCELISELEDGTITTYTQGNFTDLCRGPHIPNTAPIKAVKLLSVAGAYWRGDENRKQLTRIYGVSFPKKKQLDEYLALLEEAKKRDHRKLGKELELFMFSQTVGQGLPLWLPRGAALRDRLEQYLRKIQKRYDYQQVITPHIGNKQLYVTSGHYAKYGKDSFQPIHTPEEGEEYLLKPMNCPHHCEIFKAFPRSYKDLPIRFAEFGTVYRYEQSGELHGLTRVRSFTQDDAQQSALCRTWAAINGKPIANSIPYPIPSIDDPYKTMSFYYDFAQLLYNDLPPNITFSEKALGSTDGAGNEIRFTFTTTLAPEEEWMNRKSNVNPGFTSNYYRFYRSQGIDWPSVYELVNYDNSIAFHDVNAEDV